MRLRAAGVIDAAGYHRLVAAATAPPTDVQWARFLRLLLLVAGAALLLAGVTFFFAWNWADLHRFAKLGLVAGGMVVGVVAALGLGLNRLAGRISLSASALLIGVLFAVFGQIYQTGADAWQLFALWSGLSVFWVAGARFGPLLLGWILLVAITYGLVVQQVLVPRSDHDQLLLAAPMVAWFAAAALLWHRSGRSRAWLAGELGPRALGGLGLTGLTIEACPVAYGEASTLAAVSLVGLAAVVFGAVVRRQQGRLDVAATAAATLAGLVWLDILIGWVLFDQLDAEVFGFLLMVLVLTSQVAIVARWLLAGERARPDQGWSGGGP